MMGLKNYRINLKKQKTKMLLRKEEIKMSLQTGKKKQKNNNLEKIEKKKRILYVTVSLE